MGVGNLLDSRLGGLELLVMEVDTRLFRFACVCGYREEQVLSASSVSLAATLRHLAEYWMLDHADCAALPHGWLTIDAHSIPEPVSRG